MTEGIVNVKIDHALTFGMSKKVFSLSFSKIEWVCVALLGFKILPQWSESKLSVPSIYIVVLDLGDPVAVQYADVYDLV